MQIKYDLIFKDVVFNLCSSNICFDEIITENISNLEKQTNQT